MRNTQTILIIGKNGQVGWELCRTMTTLGKLIMVDYPEVDLSDPGSIRACIQATKPNVVVNAAAYTAVDKAESQVELAEAINGDAPGIIADEVNEIGGVMVHYSTDYVYDGTKDGPYTEEDITNPLSVYGRTKLKGDEAVLSSDVPAIILRTSWVYGWRGSNFLLTMMRLLREKTELRVVADQYGAPTWSRFVAEITAQIVARGVDDLRGFIRRNAGIYNMTCAGSASWFDFAKMIAESDPKQEEHICHRIVPITTEEYPVPAKRPMNSTMDLSKIQNTFNLRLPVWELPLRYWHDGKLSALDC